MRNPYEFLSTVVSATGARASRYSACIARSLIVGMPRARSLPFAFGMCTRRKGRGLYPFGVRRSIAARLAVGVLQSSRSTPGVRVPWF